MGLINIRPHLDPEALAALEQSERIAAANPAPMPGDINALRNSYNRDRAFWNEGGPEPASRLDFEIDRGPHCLAMRLYKPAGGGTPPVLLFLHGGGFILGNLETHDRIARWLCVESGWAVASLDYRLAPECKFPGPLEDSLAAVGALRRRGGELGIDAARMAVGGDSAGANLSLATLIEMRDNRNPGIAGLLFYGAYGLRDGAARRLYGGPEDGLTPADMELYISSYLNGPEDRDDARYNLLSANLTGLPPLHILEVALDPLADDSRALATILRGLGAPHEHHVAEGVLHGFLHQGRMVMKARDALDQAAAFLRDGTPNS